MTDAVAVSAERSPDPALKRKVVQALARILPAANLLHEAEDVKPYECDGLSAFRTAPMVVALPDSEAQVREILRACHALRVPVIARGAGTGLSGGALPLASGVLLVLARFTRILELDPVARTARLQPGVRNLAISEAAACHGLYYAPDPSSQIACTIGGNVAENAGGMHCLKYGLTVHNVLKLRALTIEGELIEVGSDAPDAPGYDLLALMTGSEGLLAVITEVTVKLLPKPERAQCILAAFNDIAAAGQAVASLIAAGIVPAALELMDRLTIQAVEPFAQAGYPQEAAAILLCESDGGAHEVAAEIERMRGVIATSGATEVRVSRDEEERLKFWAGRKSAFPAAGRISPDYYCMDGTIPKSALPLVLNSIAGLSKKYGLACMNVFHAGDGNLHPLILYDASRVGDLEKTLEFGNEILRLSIAVGGTITGEHGVGVEKLDGMCMQFSAAELRTFHAVKSAFDELALLNPGKAVPTLNRCAEFGRMHVHAGADKFPGLVRF
jgi:glycolate oxidase